MELYINNDQDQIEVAGLKTLIKQVLQVGLELEQIGDEVEVSITFVDDAMIQELNNEYRGIDQVTDVLSFAQDDGFEFEPIPGLPRILGDIVISLPQAVVQATDYGHSLQREVGYLTAHGLLHLLGYDHQEQAEKQIMRAKEEEIMAQVNLGR